MRKKNFMEMWRKRKEAELKSLRIKLKHTDLHRNDLKV